MFQAAGNNLQQGSWGPSMLKELKQMDNIVVTSADKGRAVIIWSKQQYLDEGYRQLADKYHLI